MRTGGTGDELSFLMVPKGADPDLTSWTLLVLYCDPIRIN